MRISVDFSAVRQTTAFEYGIRFLLGGLITAIAGVVADKFGPAVGGLFLAFPAILPATTSLVEKHEIEKKRAAGLPGQLRGTWAAALEATGAAVGSIGLIGFAIFVEHLVRNHNPWPVLVGATIAWFVIAGLIWRIRESGLRKRLRVNLHHLRLHKHA